MALAGCLLLGASASEAQSLVRQVLVLQSFNRGILVVDSFTGNFRVDVEQRAGRPVNFVQVVMGPTGFVGAPEQAVVDYVKSTFAGRPKPDLIVTVAGPAAVFARKHRQELFPDTPLLFASVDQRFLLAAPLGEHETAVAVKNDYPRLVDEILQLLPQTRQVFVVMDSGQLGRFWRQQLEDEFKRFHERLTFIWSSELSLSEILHRAASLPSNSAIVYLSLGTDAQGGAYADERVLADLHATANAPMFAAHSPLFGHGIVGGTLMPIDDLSRSTADVAVRILNGAPPASISVPPEPPGKPVFDWRELQRWGIPESRLPPGSEVRFRAPTFWEQYKWESIGILCVVLGLGAIVVVLVRSLLRGKRLTRELKDSESQLLQGRADLKDQLRFELLATDISSMLMDAPAEELGQQIVPALRQMAQLLGFEAATLWLWTGKDAARRAYGWHKPDMPGLPSNLTDKDFPWSARELFVGRDVRIGELDDFPPEAQTDRATSERYGLKSMLAVPIFVSSHPVGVLSMGSFHEELSVSPQLVQRQRVLGNLLGNALVRARSEVALRESEERMVLATEAAQLGMWMWDIPRNTVWLTDKLREVFGFSATEEVTYESFRTRIHYDDRAEVNRAVERALADCSRYHVEYRAVRPDGTMRWMAGTGRVKPDSTGAPVLMLGVSMDISERRRAEEESRELSGKLITAQEDERKRIARDLHDDLNQRLALLSVQMEIFGADSKDNRGAARERLDSMTSQVRELSSEVHRLSYQLHPAKLDQLGLVVAARTFCREVSAQSGIAVHFEQEEVPRDVDTDVALCLYRVIQEALQNSVRHGGAAAIQVKLTCASEQIQLCVTDDGEGFDVDYAMHNGGLGLVSMRERARQVNGSIQFTSSPGQGTRIELTVPMRCRTAAT